MLLPLPAPPMQLGPPTELALNRRPWMLAVLILQSVLVVLRIMLLLDIMGGFIMLIMVAIGWYAWKELMHITFLSCWGMLCLINGAFDCVRLVDLLVKTHMPLFSSSAPLMYNINAAVQLAIPIADFMGTALTWSLYKDYEAQDAGQAFAVPGGRYGTLAEEAPRPAARVGNNNDGDAGFGNAAPRPFEGQGHRLGSN